MHCPWCGDNLVEAGDGYACRRGSTIAGLVRQALERDYPDARERPEADGRPMEPDRWFCPGCGVPVAADLSCPDCGVSLKRLLSVMLEWHGHRSPDDDPPDVLAERPVGDWTLRLVVKTYRGFTRMTRGRGGTFYKVQYLSGGAVMTETWDGSLADAMSHFDATAVVMGQWHALADRTVTCDHCGASGTRDRLFKLSLGGLPLTICRRCGWPQRTTAGATPPGATTRPTTRTRRGTREGMKGRRVARRVPMCEWWLIDARAPDPQRLTAARAAEIVGARRGRVRFRFVFLGTYVEAVEVAKRIAPR